MEISKQSFPRKWVLKPILSLIGVVFHGSFHCSQIFRHSHSRNSLISGINLKNFMPVTTGSLCTCMLLHYKHIQKTNRTYSLTEFSQWWPTWDVLTLLLAVLPFQPTPAAHTSHLAAPAQAAVA